VPGGSVFVTARLRGAPSSLLPAVCWDHYAPIADALVGEPESICAFLGSGSLGRSEGMHRPGPRRARHAHRGAAIGAIGSVPVHNVAVQVTGQDFALLEI